MSDLTDEELGTLRERIDARLDWTPPVNLVARDEIIAIIDSAVTELLRHRAAQTADRERVREVVIAAVVATLNEYEPCEPPAVYDSATMLVGEKIASRAAEQLAGSVSPVLTDDEFALIAQALVEYRSSRPTNDAERVAIDKLLAAHRKS